MTDRLRRAIARQERMRKARDRGWMVFAGFACAALFGWIAMVAELIGDQPVTWWAVLVYAVIAVVSTLGVVRAFAAAQRLARRAEEPQMERSGDPQEIQPSVWNEILRRRQ